MTAPRAALLLVVTCEPRSHIVAIAVPAGKHAARVTEQVAWTRSAPVNSVSSAHPAGHSPRSGSSAPCQLAAVVVEAPGHAGCGLRPRGHEATSTALRQAPRVRDSCIIATSPERGTATPASRRCHVRSRVLPQVHHGRTRSAATSRASPLAYYSHHPRSVHSNLDSYQPTRSPSVKRSASQDAVRLPAAASHVPPARGGRSPALTNNPTPPASTLPSPRYHDHFDAGLSHLGSHSGGTPPHVTHHAVLTQEYVDVSLGGRGGLLDCVGGAARAAVAVTQLRARVQRFTDALQFYHAHARRLAAVDLQVQGVRVPHLLQPDHCCAD